MSAKSKVKDNQMNFTFPRKDLWEQFPHPQRVRCRELIVQLLQAVALANPQPADPHERKNQA
jgi:hypothetical protein